jgi:hypothetical protein
MCRRLDLSIRYRLCNRIHCLAALIGISFRLFLLLLLTRHPL